MMLVVVPREEVDAVRTSIVQAAEPRRELGPVLHGLELRFGVGIVVRDVRPRVRLGHAQIRQQQRHRLDFIDDPRSAWIVNWPGTMPWHLMVAAMRRVARLFDSLLANSQPTT